MGTQKKVPSGVGGDKDTLRAQCFWVLVIRESPGKDLKAKKAPTMATWKREWRWGRGNDFRGAQSWVFLTKIKKDKNWQQAVKMGIKWPLRNKRESPGQKTHCSSPVKGTAQESYSISYLSKRILLTKNNTVVSLLYPCLHSVLTASLWKYQKMADTTVQCYYKRKSKWGLKYLVVKNVRNHHEVEENCNITSHPELSILNTHLCIGKQFRV